jgi:hypothetical protein
MFEQSLRLLALGIASVHLMACGGAPPDPSSASDAEGGSLEAPAAPETAGADSDGDGADSGEPEENTPPGTLPTKCSKKGAEMCTPPVAFVKRLCAGFHPDVALALFRDDSPWTRGYLAANVKAWNASGGASSEDELKFDEEVIVLHHRKASTDGIQVSGAGDGYDVLRWDGTCATLSGGELTLTAPPKAKHASILWKDLNDSMRAALLEDGEIDATNRERKKECKGVSMGTVSKKCVQLVGKQSDLIVKFVREGGAIPAPQQIP